VYVRNAFRLAYHPLAVGVGLAVASPAHAAVLSATCRPSDSDLACRLRSVLTILDTAAWILGSLLIIAVLAAVRAYRKKPRKITPDQITPDSDAR
jgi:hypothetical protein